MTVRIQLDNPSAQYTNFDFVNGRVFLNLTHDEPVSSIVVKLEGESKTRLAGPRSNLHDRPDNRKFELELHKVGALFRKVRVIFEHCMLTGLAAIRCL